MSEPKEPSQSTREAHIKLIVTTWYQEIENDIPTSDLLKLEKAIATALEAGRQEVERWKWEAEQQKQMKLDAQTERDTLAQQLAESKEQLEHIKFLTGPDESGLNVHEREHHWKQQLEKAVRLVLTLEECVEKSDMPSMNPYTEECRIYTVRDVARSLVEWLSFPAIAPIRERVRKKGEV